VKTATTEESWKAFCRAAKLANANYEVVSFGDSAEMADELSALVAKGPKRATAGLLRDFTKDGSPIPAVGDYALVVDGAGHPVCIWQTTDVRVGPLISVDDAFAWDEGEGDRSRAYWLDAHRGFFERQARREGFAMHDEIETVFERFKLVWPPELAD
jgi:uncharacterized protein YhfF